MIETPRFILQEDMLFSLSLMLWEVVVMQKKEWLSMTWKEKTVKDVETDWMGRVESERSCLWYGIIVPHMLALAKDLGNECRSFLYCNTKSRFFQHQYLEGAPERQIVLGGRQSCLLTWHPANFFPTNDKKKLHMLPQSSFRQKFLYKNLLHF